MACGGGNLTRTRLCNDPLPQFGGADCMFNENSTYELSLVNETIFEETESTPCNESPCPGK